MIRMAVLVALAGIVAWAPWLDAQNAEQLTKRVLDAFGPMPSACYDIDGKQVSSGVTVRWYPMGRLIHTCGGDYIVWMWGTIREVGGVSKKADEIQPPAAKPLTCDEVLKRQEGRKATTTDEQIVFFDGTPAQKPDFSIFPQAEAHRSAIADALAKGPTFAGKFTVASWECGTGCQEHAVIDVESGLVIAYGLPTEYGVEYALANTLFVTNPITNLPPLPANEYETENTALSIARLPREYYRLTTDALSGTQYLVRQCVESTAAGYIEVEDNRLGVISTEKQQ